MKKIAFQVLLVFCWSGFALASGHGGVHWGYAGEAGPEHWGSLSPEFQTCGEGQKQSPINLTEMVNGKLPELKFDYGKTSLQIINNGHTIQADYAPGSGIKVGRDRYQLLQFHFHSRSENQIEGESFPLEAHLVHKNDKGQLAVVSVMFKEGQANPLLEKLWRYTPVMANSTMAVSGSPIAVTAILPQNKEYYAFEGSLTTPPCTEGVRWMVLKQTVTASKEQIAKFRSFFHDHDTNRPVQPLNGRIVFR